MKVASLQAFSLPKKARRLPLALGLGYVLVAGIFLWDYLLWDLTWLMGLALVPLVTMPASRPAAIGWLLPWLAVLLCTAAAYAQITTLYFFAVLLAAWWALETLGGRKGIYPVLMLLVASPLFSYLANVWSFPLRLQLSQAAVYLLQFGYPEVEAAGNLIVVKGEEFSIDPACAGLSMLAFSLLLAVFLLARQQQARQRTWPWWALGLLLFLMLGLNLACNLIRILLLVVFKIGPEQMLHEAVGLLCLVVYAVVPFYFMTLFWGRFLKNRPETASPQAPDLTRNTLLLHLALLLLLTGTGLRITLRDTVPQPAIPWKVAGFKQEVLPDNVFKFTNSQALLYMKPVRGFYSTEHHPLICWEGSGYQFKRVRQEQVGNRHLYMGTLERGKDRLFTAWWMDNGQHQTIEQTDWRWRMFKGEPGYYLVNITAASELELRQQISRLPVPYSSATVPANTAFW